MYATLGHALPRGGGWTYEPKYDGMRVLADVSARHVRLVTRNGKEKQTQFPEVVAALRSFIAQFGHGVVLDGEVVARRRRSRASAPAGSKFQPLQARMHLKNASEISRLSVEAPATLVVFDLLRDGRATLTGRSWSERRTRLESIFAATPDDPALRIGETSVRGATMLARARRAGWEGVIAKRTEARYQAGTRSDDWRKLKLQFRAEFVVGGFTEPRKSRPYLGALLLGAHDASGRLIYVGHMGGGFDRDALRTMRQRLERIERRTSPFEVAPRTNEPAHWVAPKLVVEVKFAEWTSDGRLRQPIYLGVRDDKAARDVTLEGVSMQRWGTGEIANDAA